MAIFSPVFRHLGQIKSCTSWFIWDIWNKSHCWLFAFWLLASNRHLRLNGCRGYLLFLIYLYCHWLPRSGDLARFFFHSLFFSLWLTEFAYFYSHTVGIFFKIFHFVSLYGDSSQEKFSNKEVHLNQSGCRKGPLNASNQSDVRTLLIIQHEALHLQIAMYGLANNMLWKTSFELFMIQHGEF